MFGDGLVPFWCLFDGRLAILGRSDLVGSVENSERQVHHVEGTILSLLVFFAAISLLLHALPASRCTHFFIDLTLQFRSLFLACLLSSWPQIFGPDGDGRLARAFLPLFNVLSF